MNIELYEGQECRLFITLNDDFEVYGGTTKQQFTVTKEDGEYVVTIPGQTNGMCYDPRFDIFARRESTGQEWLLESGRITLKTRHSAEPVAALSCFEYHITKTLVESGESFGVMVMGIKGDKGDTGAQGIRGDRGEQGIQGEKGEQGEPGLSAYELVKRHGYTGTEAEFTDMLATFEASAQKAVDAQILAENCAVNALKYLQEAQAILEEIKGVTTT